MLIELYLIGAAFNAALHPVIRSYSVPNSPRKSSLFPPVDTFRARKSAWGNRRPGGGSSAGKVGQQIPRKNLNIQPTIEIEPGKRFSIFVNKDLVLEPYR
jgi:type IV secretory pathway VirB10-like protein